MKTNLTVIALIIPAVASAQSGLSGSFFGALIGLAIVILIFLLLREVVMWYWKINAIIENQEKQLNSQQETNNLLSEQITLMKDYYRGESTSTVPQSKSTEEE